MKEREPDDWWRGELSWDENSTHVIFETIRTYVTGCQYGGRTYVLRYKYMIEIGMTYQELRGRGMYDITIRAVLDPASPNLNARMRRRIGEYRVRTPLDLHLQGVGEAVVASLLTETDTFRWDRIMNYLASMIPHMDGHLAETLARNNGLRLLTDCLDPEGGRWGGLVSKMKSIWQGWR